MATDRPKVRVLRSHPALEVVDGRVSVRKKELRLVVKVVCDVVYHRRLASACGPIDHSHARLTEQRLERIPLHWVVDAVRCVIKPAFYGLRVTIDPGRCVPLEPLNYG